MVGFKLFASLFPRLYRVSSCKGFFITGCYHIFGGKVALGLVLGA